MSWVFWVSQGAMWTVTALNVALSNRNLREIRTARAMRQIIWAYERELQDRGVTLPPRCVNCCQILPGHVEGCEFRDAFEKAFRFRSRITRPRIEYFPDGSQPPKFGGK